MLRNVLVPLDGSALAERALPYATELARAAGASVTLVRTADVRPRLHLGLAHLLPEDPASYLNMHADSLRTCGLVVETAVALGEPPRALVSEIEHRRPDLVVMSTHARSGFDRLVHGSVTDTVVSHGGCPVMLVPAEAGSGAWGAPRLAAKRVVVPLDGSRFSEAALPVAVDLARALGGEVLLVQAIIPLYPLPTDLELLTPSIVDQEQSLADTEDAVADYLDGLAYRLSVSERGVGVTALARIGQLPEVIGELNNTAQGQVNSSIGLVVMATHGRIGLARAILGGEADAVVRADDLPVVLVHPHDAEPAPEEASAISARGEHRHA